MLISMFQTVASDPHSNRSKTCLYFFVCVRVFTGAPPKRSPPFADWAVSIIGGLLFFFYLGQSIRHCGSAPRITMWLTCHFLLEASKVKMTSAPCDAGPATLQSLNPPFSGNPCFGLQAFPFQPDCPSQNDKCTPSTRSCRPTRPQHVQASGKRT